MGSYMRVWSSEESSGLENQSVWRLMICKALAKGGVLQSFKTGFRYHVPRTFPDLFPDFCPRSLPTPPRFLGLYLFIFLLVKCLSSLNLFSRHFHGHNEGICSHSSVGILFCLFLYSMQNDTISKSRGHRLVQSVPAASNPSVVNHRLK